MIYCATILATIVFIEGLLRSPFLDWTRRLGTLAGKAGRVVASRRISDHWKEKVVGLYAIKIFVLTVKAGLLFIGLVMLTLLPLWGYDALNMSERSLLKTVHHWDILLLSLAFAVIYVRARQKICRGSHDR